MYYSRPFLIVSDSSQSVSDNPFPPEQLLPIQHDLREEAALKLDEQKIREKIKGLKRECTNQENGLRGLNERLNHCNDALNVLHNIMNV